MSEAEIKAAIGLLPIFAQGALALASALYLLILIVWRLS